MAGAAWRRRRKGIDARGPAGEWDAVIYRNVARTETMAKWQAIAALPPVPKGKGMKKCDDHCSRAAPRIGFCATGMGESFALGTAARLRYFQLAGPSEGRADNVGRRLRTPPRRS